MISILFYTVLAAWAGYLVRKYRKSGEKEHLKSGGAVVMLITFFATMGLGIDAVLYPEKTKWMFAVLCAGSLGGGLLIAAGYAGWRKLYALGQVLLFLLVTNFLAQSMNYFHKGIIHSHATAEADKLVPGVPDADLMAMAPEKKKEAAARLLRALPVAKDSYARLGLIYKLQYMPEYAAPALPALIPLIESARGYEFDAILALLRAMGPAAAEAVPALQNRRQRAEQYDIYHIDDALKAIIPAAKSV